MKINISGNDIDIDHFTRLNPDVDMSKIVETVRNTQ